jgi:hypothetical protein
MHETDFAIDAEARCWTEARFPNSVMRAEFLDQIRLWNRIEDLPHIEAHEAADGTGLRYMCADYRREGLRKLVGSYGGRVRLDPRDLPPIDAARVAAAFDCC